MECIYMNNIIEQLDSYVNGDKSGTTKIYRDAIEEIKLRDKTIADFKQATAALEQQLSANKQHYENLMRQHHAKEQLIYGQFDMVGKIINSQGMYMGNIKAGLDNETALFAIRKNS